MTFTKGNGRDTIGIQVKSPNTNFDLLSKVIKKNPKLYNINLLDRGNSSLTEFQTLTIVLTMQRLWLQGNELFKFGFSALQFN